MATVLDLSKYSPTIISMMIEQAYENEASLRNTILAVPGNGSSVVKIPYSVVGAAAHKADGAAITYDDAGATGEISVTVDKRPLSPVMVGKLSKSTSIPMTEERFFRNMAESIVIYENAQIVAGIDAVTPGTPLSVDFESEGITKISDITERLAAELGTAAGLLKTAKMGGRKWALMDPRVAGRFLTGGKFASAEFAASLGTLQVGGLFGAATWLNMGFLAHPAMASKTVYTGGGATHTTSKIFVYEEQVLGEVVASDIEFYGPVKDPGTGEDVAWCDAVMGFGSGRSSALVELAITLEGNPFGLSA